MCCVFSLLAPNNTDIHKVEQTFMKNDSGKNISVVKFIFKLEVPISQNMHNYLVENKAKKETEKVIIQNPAFKIPLFNFYAAAGSFSEIQSDKTSTNISIAERYSSDDYFACKIVGESMNRRIPNGSICLFKKYSGGSRNGKIVLIENRDYQDPDFNSAFTIKTYSSKIEISEEGWKHKYIALKPNSFDTSYKDIIITEENSENMKIVAEFIDIIT
ncbi:MAG: hypothetical protein COB98_08430 [Flavobacteriaceae bacterium]|nr:MAG: hypothetical protein COB98_08430 [Flavobacteriaceae bacterium]